MYIRRVMGPDDLLISHRPGDFEINRRCNLTFFDSPSQQIIFAFRKTVVFRQRNGKSVGVIDFQFPTWPNDIFQSLMFLYACKLPIRKPSFFNTNHIGDAFLFHESTNQPINYLTKSCSNSGINSTALLGSSYSLSTK